VSFITEETAMQLQLERRRVYEEVSGTSDLFRMVFQLFRNKEGLCIRKMHLAGTNLWTLS